MMLKRDIGMAEHALPSRRLVLMKYLIIQATMIIK